MAKSTIPQRELLLRVHAKRLEREDPEKIEAITKEELHQFEFCRDYLDKYAYYMGRDKEEELEQVVQDTQPGLPATTDPTDTPENMATMFSGKEDYLKSIYETSALALANHDLEFTPEEQTEHIRNRNHREALRQKLNPKTQDSIDRQDGLELYMELLDRSDINNFFDDHKSAFYKLPGQDYMSAKDYHETRIKEWGDMNDEKNSYIQKRMLDEASEIAKQAMNHHHYALEMEQTKHRQENHPELALQLDSITNVEKKLFAYKSSDDKFGAAFEDLIKSYKDLRKEELKYSIPNSVDSPEPKVVSPELALKIHQEEKDRIKATEAQRLSQPYNLSYTPIYELDSKGKPVATLSVTLKTKEGENLGSWVCPGHEPNKDCRAWIKSTIAEKEKLSPEQVIFTKGEILGIKVLSVEEAFQRKQDRQAKRQNMLPAVEQYQLDDLVDFAQQHKSKGQKYIAEEVSKQLYEGRTTAPSQHFLEKLAQTGVPFLSQDDYKKLSNLQDYHQPEYEKMKAQQSLLDQMQDQTTDLQKRRNVPDATISLKNSELYYESNLEDKGMDKKIQDAGIPILSKDIYLAAKDFEKKQSEKKAQEVQLEERPSIKQTIGNLRMRYNK